MKTKKNNIYFVLLVAASLIGLIFIQVHWIFRAAENQEALFTRSVNLALSKSAQDLAEKVNLCSKIKTKLEHNIDGLYQLKVLDKHETLLLDSILKSNLKLFHIDLCYEFEIADNTTNISSGQYTARLPSTCYKLNLEKALNKNSAQLKIHFPKKTEFLIAQMGTMFITSMVLILVLMIVFVLILRSLKVEKILSQNTRDFINNMTHEFKTPLSSVILATKLVRKNAHVDEKTEKYLSIITDESKKLKKQVEVLLQIASMEHTAFKTEQEAEHIHLLLSDALKPIEIQVAQRNGKFVYDYQAKADVVSTDKFLMTKAFANLLDNANKYSPKKPEITIRTENTNDSIAIFIEDKGIGVSKDKQKFIFEKFYRVSTGDIHNVKGFGLGLTFVKKVVEAHSGTISLHSEENIGSTFKITLPLVNKQS